MSTALSPSPSPVSSPHSAFLPPSPRPSFAPAQRSPVPPRSSPRHSHPSSYSPRRPFHHPPAPSFHRSRQHFIEAGPVAGSFRGYTSRGTQYSPDGSPPTASTKVATDAGKQSSSTPGGGGGGAHSGARKRKEAAFGSELSSESMSGTHAASGVSQRSRIPPGEPQPRITPGQASRSTATSVATATSSTVSADEQEPQEARSTHGHSAAPKRSRPEPGSLKVMPLQYETCNPKDLGVLIANMLMELIRINDRIPLRDGRLTRFHSRAPPGISVSDYLQRLIQHATLSPPILLSTVYYIDRLCTLYPAFTINSLTVHRFLITAATVAAKGLSDSFWTNPTYARIGGIPVSELATLELELLQRVQWKIVPKPEVLEEYYASLVERTEGYTLEGSAGSGSERSSISEGDPASKTSEERMEKGEDEKMDDGPT